MKIHIENTTRITEVSGVPARIWEGHTEAGIPVIVFVTRIAVEREADCAEFERDLREMRTPSADAAAWPARMFVDDEEIDE